MRGLTAVVAVFRTSASFDGQQGAALHHGRVVVLAMDGGGVENKIEEGSVEYFRNLFAAARNGVGESECDILCVFAKVLGAEK